MNQDMNMMREFPKDKDPFTVCAIELLKKHGVDTDKLLADMHRGVNPEVVGFKNVTGSRKCSGSQYYELSTFRFREVEDGDA